MNIIKSTPNLDSKTIYQLTRGKGNVKVSNMVGSHVEIKDYIYFEDSRVNESTGEEYSHYVLTFCDPAGIVYGTISRTFIDEFLFIVDLFGDTPRIKIIRENTGFITCTIADD